MNRRSTKPIRREPAEPGPGRSAITLLALLWLGIGFVPALPLFARPYADPRWLVVIAGLTGVMALMIHDEKKRTATSTIAWPDVLRGRDPVALGALLIVIGLLVSALASPNPLLGIRIAVREGFLVGVAFALSRLKIDDRDSRRVVFCIVGATGLQAVIGLFQAFAGDHRGAIHGTMEQSEALSDFVASGAVAAAVAAIIVNIQNSMSLRAEATCVFVAVAIAGAAVVFIAGGRGGALAGTIALLAALIAMRTFSIKWLAWGAAVILLFGALYAALPLHRNTTLFSRFADIANPESTPIRHRIGLLTVSSHMVADRPLAGSGPGRFAAAFSAMQGRLAENDKEPGWWWSFNEMTSNLTPAEAHCDPLQWWAEYGLFACLGLMLMIAAAVIRGFASMREADPWRAALWTAFVATAIVMWVSYPLHDPMRALFFWSLLGILAGKRNGVEVRQ